MKHSLTNRIIIGKSLGLLTGIIVFFLAPLFNIQLEPMLAAGLILFYMLLGSFIAFIGLFEQHPLLNFKMSWWFRGIIVGLIFHTMLVFLTYSQLIIIIQQMNILGLQSPWWALLDGIIIGLIVAYIETKLAGEGKIPLK